MRRCLFKIGDITPIGTITKRRVEDAIHDGKAQVRITYLMDDAVWVDQHHVTRSMWGKAYKKLTRN